MDSLLGKQNPIISAPVSVLGVLTQPVTNIISPPEPLKSTSAASASQATAPPTHVSKRDFSWKSQSFLWLAMILFLVLFIVAWVSYDPDQRIFTIYNVAQNGTYDFPRFSGQILIRDANQGSVTEWLVGGGVATLIGCSGGCADPNAPNSGLIVYNESINGYTWTQSQFSALTTYTFITNRIVKNA